MKILLTLCILLYTSCHLRSEENIIENYKSVVIKENDYCLISNFNNFTPINDNLFIITQSGKDEALFFDSNGVFVNKFIAKLDLVDSIAKNMKCASRYMADSMRFLYLDEITVPPNVQNEGQVFPREIVAKMIEIEFRNCIVVDDSLIAFVVNYNMFVQDMNKNTDRFLRGGENAEIILIYNFIKRELSSIRYLQYKDNIYPFADQIAYNRRTDAFYCNAILGSKYNKTHDSIPLLISINRMGDFSIDKYCPSELLVNYKKYNALGLKFIDDNKGNLFCSFVVNNKIYNLSNNNSFEIGNSSIKSNSDFINFYNENEPKFDKLNYTVKNVELINSNNLLSIIYLEEGKEINQRFIFQEFTKEGKLVNEKLITINDEIGSLYKWGVIKFSNMIYGISYSKNDENYKLFKFRW